MKQTKTSVYVIHYTPLKNRRNYLEQNMTKFFNLQFVTEKDIRVYRYSTTESVFGISKKLIGMDQGINSRSLVYSRRKAKVQGYLYYLLSYVGPINKRYPELTTGSLNAVKKLPKSALEVQAMHFRALELGVSDNSDWIFIIEDDAVLNYEEKTIYNIINKITQEIKYKKVWIDLNDGANLKRTKSEKKIDGNNLFRVRPPTTRCAVAYLITRNLAKEILNLIEVYGSPEWMYIDNLYQVATRKLKAKSFWQDPPIFSQGSDSGKYESGFESQRKSFI